MAAAQGGRAATWASGAYVRFRPRYPPELLALVLGWAGLAPGQRRLALDLGCGSGQATADLAPLFGRVIGVDPSADQLAHADRSRPNVEYVCRPAEDLRGVVAEGTVDLVTCATSLHWMRLPEAYREVRRVLAPGGAFAAWAYTPRSFLAAADAGGLPPGTRCAPDPAAVDALQGALLARLRPFIPPPLLALDEHGYAGFAPGSQDFAESECRWVEMRLAMSLEQMANWVRSWSAYPPFCEAHGEAAAEQLLAQYRRDLARLLGMDAQDGGALVATRWPLCLLLARRPLPLPPGGDA